MSNLRKYLTMFNEDTVERISEHLSTVVNESTTLPNEISTGIPMDQPVELPDDTTPDQVTDVINEVETIREDIDENGITQQTMRAYLASGIKQYESLFQVKFPDSYDIKPNSRNIKAAAKMIDALDTITMHLKNHFLYR